MQYYVRENFHDEGTGANYRPGDVINLGTGRALKLRRAGVIGNIATDKKSTEKAVRKQPVETATAPEPEEKAEHIGGGWYQLPNGERVHGKKAVEEWRNQ